MRSDPGGCGGSTRGRLPDGDEVQRGDAARVCDQASGEGTEGLHLILRFGKAGLGVWMLKVREFSVGEVEIRTETIARLHIGRLLTPEYSTSFYYNSTSRSARDLSRQQKTQRIVKHDVFV